MVCPACGRRMGLVLVQPHELGKESRMFKCEGCGHAITEIVFL